MYRTRRRALSLMSGIPMTPRPPRGGWRREGGSDGGGDGSAGGGPAGGGANDGAGDDHNAGDGSKKPKFTGEFDPDRAQRAIDSARDNERKAKADKKAADEENKSLTDRATKAEQRAEALTVQLAVREAADEHSANMAELLDSRKFTDQLKELDPTASDYGDKVAALVAKAVKENPAKYGTTPAKGGSGRSGSSDHTGGNGGRQRPGLGAAIAARMTN
jgi:hypothetical protein